MTIKELDPQIVWKNFYALTQIPRPSKHEELDVSLCHKGVEDACSKLVGISSAEDDVHT